MTGTYSPVTNMIIMAFKTAGIIRHGGRLRNPDELEAAAAELLEYELRRGSEDDDTSGFVAPALIAAMLDIAAERIAAKSEDGGD